MRRNFQQIPLLPLRGLNEQVDKCQPGEALSVRNVWAPDGAIISRPGYVGLRPLIVYTDRDYGTDLGEVIIEQSGTIIDASTLANGLNPVDLTGLTIPATIYLGFYPTDLPSDPTTLTTNIVGLSQLIENWTTTTPPLGYIVQYWNGTEWLPLQWTQVFTAESEYSYSPSGLLESIPLVEGSHVWNWIIVPPFDWAPGAISTSPTVYFLRIVLAEFATGGDTIASAELVTSGPTNTAVLVSERISSYFITPMLTSTAYLALQLGNQSANLSITSGIFPRRESETITQGFFLPDLSDDGTKPTDLVAIPEFRTIFLAAGGEMFEIILPISGQYSDTIIRKAQVEDEEILVGTPTDPDQPVPDWSKSLVAQEAEFPKAEFIEWYGNQLWLAKLPGAPYDVQWTPPAPYYKVFPVSQRESLVENDNSYITGLKGYGDNMYVFKNDSIWAMLFAGTVGEGGITSYTPRKVVAGTGTVSNSSIQSIRGQLVFLAEDGIYAFNGTPIPTKLSDRIQKTINSINPKMRQRAVSVNWKTKSLYLLAVATGSSQDNNLVIVWDYKNDSWWLWDDMYVSSWALSEDSNDNEILYFVDKNGCLYQMDRGKTSHGKTIVAEFETANLNFNHEDRKRVRGVQLSAQNTSQTIKASVLADDEFAINVTEPEITILDSTKETVWSDSDPAPLTWNGKRIYQFRLAQRKDADYFRVRVKHDKKNSSLRLNNLKAEMITLGRR